MTGDAARGDPARNGMTRGTQKTKTRWSQQVTEKSDALDLDEGVFTWKDPRRIARSLRRSADRSARRKSSPFRSAMSMLTFYMNRAGSGLSAAASRRLDQAKDELRDLYGRPRRVAPRKRRPRAK